MKKSTKAKNNDVKRGHLLMTKELERQIPKLYATDSVPCENKKIITKYFAPDSNWTWYVTEFDPVNGIFFGYVIGFESEWGNFSLKELEESTGTMGLPIERDLYWKPCTLQDILDKKARG